MLKVDCHIHFVDKPDNIFYNDFFAYIKTLDYGLLLATSFPKKIGKNNLSNENLLKIISNNCNIKGLLSFDITNFIPEKKFFLNKNILGLKFYTGYYGNFNDNHIENIIKYIEYGLKQNKKVFMFHAGITNIKNNYVFDPNLLNIIFQKYKNKKIIFIISHMGNPMFIESLKLIYKYNNVYGDISGFFDKNIEKDRDEIKHILVLFKNIIKFKLINKIFIGTDFPIVNYEKNIKYLEKILPTKEYLKIIILNTFNLLK